MIWIFLAVAVAFAFSRGSAGGGNAIPTQPQEPSEIHIAAHRGMSVYRLPDAGKFRWRVRSGTSEDYSKPVLATAVADSEGKATQAAFEWIDLVLSATPQRPLIVGDTHRARTISKGDVPASIEQGGTPLPAGWTTLEPWYRYKSRWIRVDRGPEPTPALHFRTASNLPEGGPWLHYGKSYRPFRWTVVAGDSPTPLATGTVAEPTEIGVWGSFPPGGTVENARADYTARLAADWIDATDQPPSKPASVVPATPRLQPIPFGWDLGGWYSYHGLWIRVDIKRGTGFFHFATGWWAFVSGNSLAYSSASFTARMRWTVFGADSATPLASAEVDAEGEIDISGPSDPGDPAKDQAIDKTARLAADWIDLTGASA